MKKINQICSLSIYKLIRLITLDFLKDIKHIDKHVAFTTGNTIINKLTSLIIIFRKCYNSKDKEKIDYVLQLKDEIEEIYLLLKFTTDIVHNVKIGKYIENLSELTEQVKSWEISLNKKKEENNMI